LVAGAPVLEREVDLAAEQIADVGEERAQGDGVGGAAAEVEGAAGYAVTTSCSSNATSPGTATTATSPISPTAVSNTTPTSTTSAASPRPSAKPTP